jgi:branched-chain amino acid transport system substrate-binding protein
MDRFIGNWWSASDADLVPAGEQGKGYKGATFHAPGTAFPVHAEIFKTLYDKGQGTFPERDRVGEVLYNRGVVNAMFNVEAVRTAMAKHGKSLTPEQIRWGFENLNLTDKRLEELGMKGFTKAVKVTCENHEGNGQVLIQQWDGKRFKVVSDFIEPIREVVRPKLEEAAVEEAKKLGYSKRDCSKEM